MARRSVQSRVQGIVTHTLREQKACDVERILVADAVVLRAGNHYRILSGGDPISPHGRCGCGAVLPLSGLCELCGAGPSTPASG